MAAATLVNTPWGTRAHTGTDATAVKTGYVKLHGIHCQGTAGAETVTVTDTAGTQLIKVVTTVANADYFVDWKGRMVEGLIVTLSASTVSANFLIE